MIFPLPSRLSASNRRDVSGREHPLGCQPIATGFNPWCGRPSDSAPRRGATGLNPWCVALLLLAGCAGAPPAIPDLALERGRNALDMGRYDWARRYFQQDLESNPGRPESLRGLGLGWVSGFEGSLTRGIEAFSSYLEQLPDDTEVRLSLARSWLRLSQPERVLEVLADAGDSAAACELRAQALQDADPQEAERQAALALELEPETYSVLLLAARLADDRDDTELALERAQAAARIDPTRPDIFYLLARIRRSLGDEDGARRDLDTYQQLRRLPARNRPSKLSPYEELQALRDLAPRLEATARPLRQRLARLMLITGDPDTKAAISELKNDRRADGLTLLELAGEAHSRGRVALARDLYQRTLELDPRIKSARSQLARLEHETGDRDLARQLLAEGLETDPYYAPYHFVSGLIALSEESEPGVPEGFETALELMPWHVPYRLAMADVYLAAGQREDLRRVLEEAPAEDPAIAQYRRRHLG